MSCLWISLDVPQLHEMPSVAQHAQLGCFKCLFWFPKMPIGCMKSPGVIHEMHKIRIHVIFLRLLTNLCNCIYFMGSEELKTNNLSAWIKLHLFLNKWGNTNTQKFEYNYFYCDWLILKLMSDSSVWLEMHKHWCEQKSLQNFSKSLPTVNWLTHYSSSYLSQASNLKCNIFCIVSFTFSVWVFIIPGLTTFRLLMDDKVVIHLPFISVSGV